MAGQATAGQATAGQATAGHAMTGAAGRWRPRAALVALLAAVMAVLPVVPPAGAASPPPVVEFHLLPFQGKFSTDPFEIALAATSVDGPVTTYTVELRRRSDGLVLPVMTGRTTPADVAPVYRNVTLAPGIGVYDVVLTAAGATARNLGPASVSFRPEDGRFRGLSEGVGEDITCKFGVRIYESGLLGPTDAPLPYQIIIRSEVDGTVVDDVEAWGVTDDYTVAYVWLELPEGRDAALVVTDGYHEMTWRTFTAGTCPAPAGQRRELRTLRSIYQTFLDRPPTRTDIQETMPALLTGTRSRAQVGRALAVSDEWLSRVIGRYYRDTLRREPDPAGLSSWAEAARQGAAMDLIASAFYASSEYYTNFAGGDDAAWVRSLYRKLLFREADSRGLAEWVAALQAGASRQQVVRSFYQAPETLRVRVDTVYQDVLGRHADPTGLASWAPAVRDRGELVLAATLVSSVEFEQRANR